MFVQRLFAGLAALAVAGSAAAADCALPSDAEAGKSVSNQCKSCHEFAADKPSRATGPNIHDVFGAPMGSRKDFARYSEGMQGAADKGGTWTEANLMEYVGDPKAFLDKINGAEVKHGMFFQLKDEQKRKDIIAFLKAIKGKPECN